ncbi:MAG: type II toxin-antitoxin system PemK/MazF family toxin [Candidatus Peregrinibacteria bacterium]
MKKCYKKGEIVFVNFPYTNFIEFKVRPALVLRNQYDDDVLLLPISTTVNLQRHDLVIKEPHYAGKALTVESAVRIGKMTNVESDLIIKKFGQLKPEFFKQVQKAVIDYLVR